MATDKIAQALRLKSDYTEAIFLLSQIEIGEGKVDDAISSVEAATFLTPQDPLAFFQLGVLRYSNGDYAQAITAFERAILLDNQYSNARYFLGLAYYKKGRLDDAIDQFTEVLRLNPDNTEVKAVIANIKAGKSPFDTSTPSKDPFEGFGLPVKE